MATEYEVENILQEQILKLPREVTRFLASAHWSKKLEEIGAAHNLSPEEHDRLKDETVIVLAGLLHPDAYQETLGAALGVGPTVTDIVTRVEREIFAPVRPYLVKFFEQEQEHYGENEVMEKQARGIVPEIPSPWSVAHEETASTPTGKTSPLTPQKTETSPQEPPRIPVPPEHLPGEQPQELVWKPEILKNIPPAQPLPRLFNPLGKKSDLDAEKEMMHPFEKAMQANATSKKVPGNPPGTSTATSFQAPEQPFEQGSVSTQNSPKTVVTPPQNPVRSTIDPYREPIE